MLLINKIFASILELLIEFNMIDLPEIPEVPLPPIQKIIKESPDIAQWFLLLTDVVNKIVDKVNSL